MATTGLHEYVTEAAGRGWVVVQPRMGMAAPDQMAAGIAAVAGLSVPTVATITVDSYTRVRDDEAVARALADGADLNGFPIVGHGPRVTAEVAAAAGQVPVQVRHGSADPRHIFASMIEAGLTATEGGPVSYCLPYGRTPLARSVQYWQEATPALAEGVAARGGVAHLETFGGCLMGQLCPPSLLIAVSVLEGLFFARHGVCSVSLSYAQQGHPVQDIEALAALAALADEVLGQVDRHLVLYTYMGVFPQSPQGACSLLELSARVAALGGAPRMILKTEVEAQRIPTVPENLRALVRAAEAARSALRGDHLPDRHQVDPTRVLTDARRLVHAVLELSDDPGVALRTAFTQGILDVPYCLHADNQGLSQGALDADGRLYWAQVGRMPLEPDRRRTYHPVTSDSLLRMLRHTAHAHDQQALTHPRQSAAIESARPRPLRIAVVGSGPRGISVLERLTARMAGANRGEQLEVWLIDGSQPGSGRIWRTDQSPWLMMNTAAVEVSMFSGEPDEGPARPGAGPSLAQWWARTEPAEVTEYAPRALYGRYLRFVLDSVSDAAGGPGVGLVLHELTAWVCDLVPRPDGGWRVALADGRAIEVDRVVLTTGHPATPPRRREAELARFAAQRPGLTYLHGDSAADLPLHRIPAGAQVGVIGLGLSFYDAMARLTLERGGRFEPVDGDDPLNGLVYRPSGQEPVLVAGSRRGLPIPARGVNQKRPDHRYQPRILTADGIRTARGRGRLDFRTDVLPSLLAEIDLTYVLTTARYLGLVRHRQQHEAALAAFDADLPRFGPVASLERLRSLLGLEALAALDLEALTRPFAGRQFDSPEQFHAAVLNWITDDLAHARLGNMCGPLKTALDTIRDMRSVLRTTVDHGGLTPDSYRYDFLSWYVPITAFLTTGPPAVRLAQVSALIEAGLLVLAGPGTQFDTGPLRFLVGSDQVHGSTREVDVLLDARIPEPDLRTDPAPLTQALRRRGLLTPYRDVHGEQVFETGGVVVTGAPFHPVGEQGKQETLYLLGIPSEFVRWFTQVGSGRPGVLTGFTADADAIAAHLFTAAEQPAIERASAR